jgi:cytochrome b
VNETSTFPADALPAQPAPAAPALPAARKVLIWDAPVRVFHWLMVLCFAGAYLSAESEHWRLLHVTLGYTMAGLVAFRIVWGLVGPRTARFASFVRGPAAVARYVGAMLRGQPEHHSGHNPAGAWAILGLLSLTLLIAASGWALYNEVGGAWLEEAHEVVANTMLALVAVHIGGVLVSSLLHRESLVGAMFSGRKVAPAQDGLRSAWRSVAALMLAAVLGFWAWQWQSAPSPGAAASAERPAAAAPARHADRDDD